MLKNLGSGFYQELAAESDLLRNFKASGEKLDFLINNFKEYDLTISGTNSWSTSIAKARPFKTNSGQWWCNFFISGTTSSAGGTVLTIANSAIVFYDGANQALAANNDDATNSNASAMCNSNASTITVGAPSGESGTEWRLNGTVRLKQIPTFVIQDFSFPQGFQVTRWAPYTPAPVAFGTVSNLVAWWKRLDDSLFLRFTFTTGTVQASEARLPFPSGLTSSSSLIDSTLEICGQYQSVIMTTAGMSILIEPNVSYLTFGYMTASINGLTKQNGNQITNSSTRFSGIAGPIPIAEWAT